MSKLKVLDLFSGIGGFSLGLERTGGFETVAFCEIEPYCQKVLAKHWPDVRCYDDIRSLSAAALRRDSIAVDIITGGFPCQDISFAGKGVGIEGERSGLWREYARLIGELRPRYVIVENVAALLVRGLDRVLGDLAALGYDAEWHCIPAAYVGAPHRRDRIWIVAYRGCELWETGRAEPATNQLLSAIHNQRCGAGAVADAASMQRLAFVGHEPHRDPAGGASVANAEGCGWTERDPDSRGRSEGSGAHQRTGSAGGGWWRTEPDVGRVAHGIPARVDRLKGLGNAVVPQIPELIGRAILAHLSADLARREAAE